MAIPIEANLADVFIHLRRAGGRIVTLHGNPDECELEFDGVTMSVVRLYTSNLDASMNVMNSSDAERNALRLAAAVLKGDMEAAAVLADLVLENYHAAQRNG